MLFLQILVAIGVFLLGCIFLQLNQISGAIMMLSHQLEYLGAPLEIGMGGGIKAKRRPGSWQA